MSVDHLHPLHMSRWSNLFRKRPRRSQLPLSQEAEEKLRRHFKQAEDERTQAFEHTRRQQLHELSSIVPQWMHDESSREETFHRFVSQVQDIFTTHQTKRHTMFQDMIVKHDVIFRSNEEKRDASSRTATELYNKTFHASQGERKKVLDKLVSSHERQYERARVDRQDRCQELAAYFLERFSAVLEAEKSAFERAQDSRKQELLSVPPRPEPNSPEVPNPPNDTLHPQDTTPISSDPSPILAVPVSSAPHSPETQATSAPSISRSLSSQKLSIELPPQPSYVSDVAAEGGRYHTVTQRDLSLSSPEPHGNRSSSAESAHHKGGENLRASTSSRTSRDQLHRASNSSIPRTIETGVDVHEPSIPSAISRTPSPRRGTSPRRGPSSTRSSKRSLLRSARGTSPPPRVPSSQQLDDKSLIGSSTTSPSVSSASSPARREDVLRDLDLVYNESERRRGDSFLEDQRHRERLASQIQDGIHPAGERRRKLLREIEKAIEQEFKSLQDNHEEIVQAREDTRDEGEGHRKKAQEDAEAQMNAVFNNMLSLLTMQSAMLGKTQQDHYKSCENELSSLFMGMRKTVDWTILTFQDDFTAFLERSGVGTLSKQTARRTNGTPPLVTTPSSPALSMASSILFHSELSVTDEDGEPEALADEISEMPESDRRPSPLADKLFGPSVLLQAVPGTRGLPTAANVADQLRPAPSRKTRGSSQPHLDRHHAYFHQHSRLFEQSQATRATQHATQMHRLHQEIASLNLQAKITFDQRRAAFEHAVQLKWIEQSSEFQESQQRCEAMFHAREHERRSRCESMLYATKTNFESMQRRQDEEFKEKCEEVNKRLGEAEADRVAGFMKWREQVKVDFESWMRDWREMFAREEEERQKRFADVVAG